MIEASPSTTALVHGTSNTSLNPTFPSPVDSTRSQKENSGHSDSNTGPLASPGLVYYRFQAPKAADGSSPSFASTVKCWDVTPSHAASVLPLDQTTLASQSSIIWFTRCLNARKILFL
jgi:hypothetical protein